MKICPECEDEYPNSISTCWDCNVQLVPSLEKDIPELAVVCTFLNEAKAHNVKGFLESEDIPCQLENISFHAGPAPVADLMKVRLWSKKEDVSRARKLLEEVEDFQICSSCENEVGFKDDFCSHCGEMLN